MPYNKFMSSDLTAYNLRLSNTIFRDIIRILSYHISTATLGKMTCQSTIIPARWRAQMSSYTLTPSSHHKSDQKHGMCRLFKDLGLAQPVRRQRVEIVIGVVEGSDIRVTDVRYSGNALIIPPPELIPRPTRISDAETLRQAITFPLSVKIFDDVQDELSIQCNWRSLNEGVGLWLRWEGHTLPSRRKWEYESVVQAWSKPTTLPRLDDLLSIARDCWQPPPLLEMEALNSGRPIPRSELAATLVEYLVATYGRQIIPILLRDLNQDSSWNALAQNVVNLSAEELEADWQASLLARTR